MRLTLAMAIACLGILGIATADPAQASIKKLTEIPAQGLGPALTSLAKEFDVQVLYRTEIVGTVKTQGASGAMTMDGALEHVLNGTGLTYKYLDEKTVTIIPVGSDTTPSTREGEKRGTQTPGGDQKNSFWDHFRLAQAASHSQLSPSSSTPRTLSDSVSVSDATGQAQSGGLDEIIVTSQKRAERLIDVPISISVLSGSNLDKSTTMDVTGELRNVPGVAIVDYSAGGFSQIAVRGVATGVSDTGASPTAFYLDSAPFGLVNDAISPNTDAYDLERVEVLRGPQGTLYGANALNGVVRVLTKDANLDQFEFKARGSASMTKDGGENYREDMAVNLPIIDGKLAARAVLGYQDLSGFIDKPSDPNANDAKRLNMRLKVKAQPTEELTVGLTAWSSRADYGAESIGLQNRTHIDTPIKEHISTNYDVYGANIAYDFSHFTVTSTTSYLSFANNSFIYPSTTDDANLDATTITEEIGIHSTHETSWRWTAGSMYRDGRDKDEYIFSDQYTAPSDIRNWSKSYAVFGELTRLFFNKRLELTAGLRYFNDDVTQKEASRLGGPPDGGAQPAQYLDNNDTFSATTPRVILTWHPGDNMTMYASYSEGFRSGFFQTPQVLAIAPYPPVRPDRLRNYEVGSKGNLLGGRLNFETAVYYIDWKDVQQALGVYITPDVAETVGINGTSASGVGVDFAVLYSPIGRLELGLNGSWNDLSMDKPVYSVRSAAPVELLRKGDRLDGSAKYTGGASADYSFPIRGTNLEALLGLAANYTSAEPRTVITNKNLVYHVPDDPQFNGRTTITIKDREHWTATLFGDNLTDWNRSPRKSPTNPQSDFRERPRTIGLQFEYRSR